MLQALAERDNLEKIDRDILIAAGLLNKNELLKVLGDGSISAKLEIRVFNSSIFQMFFNVSNNFISSFIYKFIKFIKFKSYKVKLPYELMNLMNFINSFCFTKRLQSHRQPRSQQSLTWYRPCRISRFKTADFEWCAGIAGYVFGRCIFECFDLCLGNLSPISLLLS